MYNNILFVIITC